MQGVWLPSFLGWISGVFFISKPCGKPKFTSYLHPYTFYALAINVFYLLLWKDYYAFAFVLLQGQKVSIQIVLLNVSVGVFVLNAYVRLIFFSFAKKISKLVQLMDSIILPTTSASVSESTSTSTFTSIPEELQGKWSLFIKLSYVMLIYYFVSSTSFIMWFQATSQKFSTEEKSIFFPNRDGPPPFWYYLMFWLLGALPAAMCTYFTFCFIFILTFRLACLFHNFCERIQQVAQFEQANNINKGAVFNINETGLNLELTKNAKSHHQDENHSNKHEMNLSSSPRQDTKVEGAELQMYTNYSNSPCALLMKEQLLDQFETVKRIFDQYDGVVGPLMLGLLIKNVFTVINGASAVIVDVDQGLNMKQCITIYFIGDVAQFVLLELGSWIQRWINKCKDDLERMLILMPESTEKNHLSQVVKRVKKWQWHLNACHFFTIERPLMAGIVSTMLTYIIIIFQLHLNKF